MKARTASLLAVVCLLLAGALAWTGCGGENGGEKPAIALPGTIVFTQVHPGSGSTTTGSYSDIYLLDAQGTRLVGSYGRHIGAHPVWSPGGTQIAYITNTNQLALINRDGSGGAYLTPESSDPYLWAWQPRWLPDGNISIIWGGKLAVLRPDGSGVYAVDPEGFSGSYCWSPDGKQVVYDTHDGTGTFAWLRLFDVESGESRELMESPRPFYALDWSPDGTKILAGDGSGAQEGVDEDQHDLYVFDPTGEGLHALTQPGREQNPAWSPDGTMIVYDAHIQKSEGSISGLGVMNADGSGAQQLLSFGIEPNWTARVD